MTAPFAVNLTDAIGNKATLNFSRDTLVSDRGVPLGFNHYFIEVGEFGARLEHASDKEAKLAVVKRFLRPSCTAEALR